MDLTLVVPVKRLLVAKSRLQQLAGPRRPDLALAFAVDAVTAALACPVVTAVVVITDDERAREQLGAAGAQVVPDEPDAGLNEALEYAVGRVRAERPHAAVAALSADLPALRPAELAAVLEAAAAWPRAFLPDHRGIGTTVLTAAPGVPLRPLFGMGSAARHLGSGAVELDPGPVPSVRLDVDTAADLRDAVDLGVGPQTAAVLAALGQGVG